MPLQFNWSSENRQLLHFSVLLLAFPLNLLILEVYRFSAAKISFDSISAKFNIQANFTAIFKGPTRNKHLTAPKCL